MATMPKWATPERRAYLVELFLRYGNLCLKGHRACPIVEHHRRMEHTLVKVDWETEARVVRTPTGEVVRTQGGKPLTEVRHRPIRKEYAYLPKPLTELQSLGNGLYEAKRDEAIAQWKADDQDRLRVLRRREQQALHADDPATTPPYGRRFDPVARHEYLAHVQPAYYPEGLGPNPLSHHLTAIIRVPSSPVRLLVDVDAARQGQSKNASRKAARYGRGLTPEATAEVARLCYEAVNDYRS